MLEEVENLSKSFGIARSIDWRTVGLSDLVTHSPERYDAENPEQQGNQRIVNECRFRCHRDPARYDPRYDQRIDECILVITCDKKRRIDWNVFGSCDSDIAVEPVECDSIDPPQ
jgi:hypothetical protein